MLLSFDDDDEDDDDDDDDDDDESDVEGREGAVMKMSTGHEGLRNVPLKQNVSDSKSLQRQL